MTTNAIVRVFDILVKNSSSDTFKMQVVQQIIKAVANVETLTPQIGKPIIQIIRDDYTTYDPTISDYSAGETYIKLWKQTGTADPELVTPAVSSDNTQTALSDAQMPNDSYKIMPAETGNTLFPVINVNRGTLTYRTGNNARVEVGAPSGYPNDSFPEPMRIDYKILYKDTAGNFHFIPLTQTLIPMDEAPPQQTLKLSLFHDFSANIAHMKNMESTSGIGDTFVFSRGDGAVPHGASYQAGRIQAPHSDSPVTNRMNNDNEVMMTSYPSRFGAAPYYISNPRKWVTGTDSGTSTTITNASTVKSLLNSCSCVLSRKTVSFNWCCYRTSRSFKFGIFRHG